jgi:imidazolonepropionase-like amidohydrolase
MNIHDRIGAIVPGALADLVILDADPLAGIENLSSVHRVVKDGEVFDPDELMRSVR